MREQAAAKLLSVYLALLLVASILVHHVVTGSRLGDVVLEESGQVGLRQQLALLWLLLLLWGGDDTAG